MALLIAGVQPVWGFALLGPIANGGDAWQTPTIGYNLPYFEESFLGGPVNLGDIGGPKNLGEGYRRNTPVIYYAYNANFLDYFGSNGVAAVDSAVAIMNKAFTTNPVTGQFLTNGVDSYSAGLSEYPPESLHINYEAQSLALTDLKSVTLHCLVEQLGLAEPERFTWTLAERVLIPGTTCPVGEEYLVVQRNYDITASPLNQLQYSAYVNDTLYTYQIDEWCTAAASPEPPAVAYTVPFNLDPYADVFTAVAANNADGLGIGGYYAGLTRDDVAGMRYLLTTNNRNWETAAFVGATAAGNSGVGAATLQTTNLGAQILLTSANLNTLLTSAQVNDPALIPGLFPGVVVASSSNYFAEVCTTNIVATIPNPNQYGAPYPNGFGTLISVSAVNCDFQQFFVTTFANVITSGNLTNNPNISLASTNITLSYSTNTIVSNVTTSLVPYTAPGQPYPPVVTPQTNSTTTTTTINVPSGEYLILPPGACGFKILNELALPPVLTTNFISSATNGNGFVDTISTVTSFTPHRFVVQPINCTSTPFSRGLYEGIETVQFVKANFDSLLGQFFQPVTNNYTMTVITNSQTVVQKFQRIATAPDILLSAADDIAANTFDGSVVRNITFNQDNVLDANGVAGGLATPTLAGPGTINPRTTIIYNKVGSAFENGYFLTALNTNVFVQEANHVPVLQWASFDASTNDPVLYPNGTSIANLQSQVLVQISPPPPTLPDGTNNAPYPAQTFTATGGAFTTPYTWALVSGLGGLPPGMSLSGDGTLSGTPTQAGTFDFTIQLTDSLGRSVNWNYTINIH